MRPTSAPVGARSLMRLDHCNEICLEMFPTLAQKVHKNSIETVHINPANPDQAITASHDHRIGVWDLNKCETTKVIENAHKQGVWCAQYNKQGTQFASCGPDTVVKIWNAKNNKLDKDLKGHTNYVHWVDFNQAGDKLVSCGKNRELMLWDVKKGKNIISLRTEGQIANCVRIDPSGKFAFTAEKKGWLEAWDLNARCSFQGKVQLPNVTNIHNIDFDFTSTNRPRIYTADSSGNFRTLEFDGMFFKQIDSYDGHTDQIKCIKVIPEKKVIVTGCRDSSIKVWSMTDNQFESKLCKHKDQVVTLDYHPDKPNRVVSGSWDQTINVYDLGQLESQKVKAQEKLREISDRTKESAEEAKKLQKAWEFKQLSEGKMKIGGRWM